MKRHKKNRKRHQKPSNKSAPTPLPAAGTPKPSQSRRAFLRKLRNGGIVAAVVGGGGWFAVRDVQATIREHDLSRIGNGMPTVVQIHDPECPTCAALQREARDAACTVGEAKVQFLVANIRTPKGRALAQAHGVAHVTLLLLDGNGQRQGVLTGLRQSEELVNAFLGHAARFGQQPTS